MNDRVRNNNSTTTPPVSIDQVTSYRVERMISSLERPPSHFFVLVSIWYRVCVTRSRRRRRRRNSWGTSSSTTQTDYHKWIIVAYKDAERERGLLCAFLYRPNTHFSIQWTLKHTSILLPLVRLLFRALYYSLADGLFVIAVGSATSWIFLPRKGGERKGCDRVWNAEEHKNGIPTFKIESRRRRRISKCMSYGAWQKRTSFYFKSGRPAVVVAAALLVGIPARQSPRIVIIHHSLLVCGPPYLIHMLNSGRGWKKHVETWKRFGSFGTRADWVVVVLLLLLVWACAQGGLLCYCNDPNGWGESADWLLLKFRIQSKNVGVQN